MGRTTCGFDAACSTKPSRAVDQKTRSTLRVTTGTGSASALASPLTIRENRPSPAGFSETSRCVTRWPSARITLTMSPEWRSAAGVVRASARAPVGIWGDIDPERNTSGVTPKKRAAAATTRQVTPTAEPSQSTISRITTAAR
ncbi:hypothetical protein GCM10025867_39040 [Frondihabitans sucicola]|uniref:Uncharacterized protein n=1 Tax=Frondihabitans sucicola TaxID=1268041 RepID=A0ABM8GT85_9MICO|nr:hypothetical protein [Frondihabitans sucicola]BDZ51663.1 hypothetical protein GCM10025867_39040 [Frondihabitans sucicola]